MVALGLALAQPVAANDRIVSADEFQAMSEGYTLHFEQFGSYYGAEQYYPGRQSTWKYSDGTCTEGEWTTSGPNICFAYRDQFGVQCWIFSERGGEFYARLSHEPPQSPEELRLLRRDKVPIGCPAPGLGV